MEQRNNMIELLPRTAADFFAGIGLVRYALERQGWKDVYALDYSEHKQPCMGSISVRVITRFEIFTRYQQLAFRPLL